MATPAPLTRVEVQRLLNPDEVLVFFLVQSNQTFVWAVTKKTMRWSRIDIGTTALQESVSALRCGLDRAAWIGDEAENCATRLGMSARQIPKPYDLLPFDTAHAHELYKVLFGSIEALVSGKHLLIASTGPLTQIPFNVLVVQPPPAVDEPNIYSKAAWLGVRQTLTVLPAVSSLRALRQFATLSTATRPLISFANPLLDGPNANYAGASKAALTAQGCTDTGFPLEASAINRSPNVASVFRGQRSNLTKLRQLIPLPETAYEACTIAASVGATTGDIWMGARATERNIKVLSRTGELAKYRILHFATHALVAGEIRASVAEPAIVLTPPSDEARLEDLEVDDGLLTASEVSLLKVDADWVILSACNTAAGGASTAEPLSGLARAFFYAGARSLLVSHWEVETNAAIELVTTAFNQLRITSGLGRAEAMRRAMAELVKQGGVRAHPAYWAPFVIVGEGAPSR